MKGVILAGGLGSRLYPLTHATNKHLLPIYDKPMVYYPIQTLVSAGISEILLVVGGPHAGHFMRVLQNGHELGIKHLEYAFQAKEGGIAEAISLAEDFADNDSIAVILGDNTTDADISKSVREFEMGALIFLKHFDDKKKLTRFGVPVFDKSGKKILRVEEKPAKPKSNYAQTGLYLYDNRVFSNIRQISPSKRGELEVSDLNSVYAKKGELTWAELEGYWSDAGTFESLHDASVYWAGNKRGL